jgi:PmbA protein
MKNLTDAIDYGLGKGCKDIELYLETSSSLDFEIRTGKLEKYQESKSQGIGVRVIKDNKQSLVYGTDDKLEALQKSIDEAIEILEFMDEDDIVIHGDDEFNGNIDSENIFQTNFDTKFKYIIDQEKNGIGSTGIKALVESTTYEENKYTKHIINSQGLNKSETGAYCGSSISLAINQDGINETGYAYFYTRDIKELFIQDLGNEAHEKAREMLGAGLIVSKKYTAIFSADVVVDLLRLLSYSFNGENIYKGKSLFKDKVGLKVISDKINIVDDGKEIKSLGFTYFDGDGVNTNKTSIIKEGVFLGGLYNLSMAKKTGTNTTGNATRSHTSLPNIGYHNLCLENGDIEVKDMISELNNGIIIKELMGLHMANPITGEFSLGASGLKIENGKVKGGFRGVTISGNILDIFSNIVAVGKDFQRRTTVGAPSLLIQDVIVSGS